MDVRTDPTSTNNIVMDEVHGDDVAELVVVEDKRYGKYWHCYLENYHECIFAVFAVSVRYVLQK